MRGGYCKLTSKFHCQTNFNVIFCEVKGILNENGFEITIMANLKRHSQYVNNILDDNIHT